MPAVLAPSASALASSTRIFAARARLVNRHSPSFEFSAIQLIDSSLGFRFSSHLHKSKAFGLTTEFVLYQCDGCNCSKGFKGLP